MKSTHIFWSLLILCGAIGLVRFVFPTNGPFGGGLNLYVLILLLLGIATALSPICIILIMLRKINPHEHFWVTFLFIVNAFWGLLLAFELWREDIQYSKFLMIGLSGLNILWAVVLLLQSMRKQIHDTDHSAA